MKKILTTVFTFLTLLVFADIPRVDVMEVSYKGKKYYKWSFVAHLKFEEGCVYDKQNGDYLYEEVEYFSNRYKGDKLKFYRDLVSIRKSKIKSQYANMDNSTSNNLIQLVGTQIELTGKQLDSIAIIKIHLGNTAGYTYSPSLSKKDENWIQDYDLEKIAGFNDGELCDLELFSIKGNISKKEALGIKNEIRSLYDEILSNNEYKGKTPDQYFDELLKRNILMIGFCSC